MNSNQTTNQQQVCDNHRTLESFWGERLEDLEKEDRQAALDAIQFFRDIEDEESVTVYTMAFGVSVEVT